MSPRVAVLGAGGRLGGVACATLREAAGIEWVGGFGSRDDWRTAIADLRVDVLFEATRAGLGAIHGREALERGVRIVIGTSGLDDRDLAQLDALARSRSLGGLIVPNFSMGALLMMQAAERIARHFAEAEILELHHPAKLDAPSGTARETARRIEAARAQPHPVPIHSVRLSGLYAHQSVLFGAPGETLSVRHDMQGPAAFAPGIVAAVRYAAGAHGVQRGLEHALAAKPAN